VGSESNRTGVLRRSSRDSRSTHTKRKGHVKTEEEIVCTQPQANDHLEPPEAGRDKEGFSQEPWRDHGPAGTLFQTSGL